MTEAPGCVVVFDYASHASLEVTAKSVRFLGGKNGAIGAAGAGQGEPKMDIDEEEIPF